MTPGQWAMVFAAGRAAIPDNGGSPAQVLRVALDAMSDAALEISLDTEVHPAYPTTHEQTFSYDADDAGTYPPLIGSPLPDDAPCPTRKTEQDGGPPNDATTMADWDVVDDLHTYKGRHDDEPLGDPYPDITREVSEHPERYFSPDDPRSRAGVWARERRAQAERQAKARERPHKYEPRYGTGPCDECDGGRYSAWHMDELPY